ncbi:hypothetical protein DFH07DRAFT_993016 [Mycena maculata]|uniref:DUF6699 domain-containing protein n=1 Tax=Mycena maculata TaxID=230809 RepID=A0AAD7MU09_9AGAR|nr:hypothetical protein DFH07DRAFT_993016 [Mycena maculata]
MPGRHVRFSSTNTFHSPPQAPPLTSATSSSSASSLGPLTPPSTPYSALPGPTPFAPRRSYTDPSFVKSQAHSFIAFSNKPVLKYDVSMHPSTISTCHTGLSCAGFAEPAVYPPQAAISLLTPHLPWAIGVPASNGSYVTVFDVIDSIYRTLRVNTLPAEFNALGSQKLMRKAAAAYTQRYERLRGHRGYTEEKKQGVKRVDFLMGYTRLQGISPTPGAPDVWQLNIG